METIEF